AECGARLRRPRIAGRAERRDVLPGAGVVCLSGEKNHSQPTATNISAQLFRGVSGNFRAVVEATQPGIVAGLGFVDPQTAPAAAGTWRLLVEDGQSVAAGDALIEVIGTAAEIGVAEDYVL